MELHFHSPALPHTNIRKSRHQRPTLSPRWQYLPFSNSWSMGTAACHQFFSDLQGFLYLQTCCCHYLLGSWHVSEMWSAFCHTLSLVPWSLCSCLQVASWDVCTWKSLLQSFPGENCLSRELALVIHSFFSMYPGITMVRHREVSGTKRGESLAEVELKLFALFLQSLGFSCFDSLVALMHKGF